MSVIAEIIDTLENKIAKLFTKINSLEKNNQIIFRYCDKDGKIGGDANPNGAIQDIAGICNAGRNVFGMMPHPERATNPLLNNTDGVQVFELLGLLKTAAAL